MCTASEFWTDYCLEYLDSKLDPLSGQRSLRILGLLCEVAMFFICFRMVATLISGFIFPAIECLSLRKGVVSETIAIVLLSCIGSMPEAGLSFVSVFKGDEEVDHSFAVGVIMGIGWISLLVVPSVALKSAPAGIYSAVFIIDILTYLMMMVVIMFVCLHEWSMLMGSSILLLLSGFHFAARVRTQELARAARQDQRERRLKIELQPLESILREQEALDRFPVDLAKSRGQYVPLRDLTSDSSTLEADLTPDFTQTEPHTKHLGFWSRFELACLCKICVRSEPGKDTERFYILSLVTACGLVLILSSVIAAVCDRWMSFVVSGLPSRFVGPVAVAAFSKLSDVLHASSTSSSAEAAHIISASLSSQIVSVILCIAIPWLASSLIRGSPVHVDGHSLKNALKASLVAVCILIVHCIYGYRNGVIHLNRSVTFFIGYLVVLFVFASLTVLDIHS